MRPKTRPGSARAGFGQAGTSVWPAPAPCPHPLSHRPELPWLELDLGPFDTVSALSPALWPSVATAGGVFYTHSSRDLRVPKPFAQAEKPQDVSRAQESSPASLTPWGDGRGTPCSHLPCPFMLFLRTLSSLSTL